LRTGNGNGRAGKAEEANRLFIQAWEKATDNFEKFTAAHYLARHQKTVKEKLQWDETALAFALKSNNDFVKGTFPLPYT
jgi:hypothetical protein